MHTSKRLAASLAAAWLMAGLLTSLEARSRKGDQLYAQASQAEQKKDYDRALSLYEQALATDPSDVSYQMATSRVRFQAAQVHVDNAQALRDQGRLEEAAAEFEKAYSIDPSSEIAPQEMRTTREMIERAKKLGATASPEDRALTPSQLAQRQEDQKLASVMPVPTLRPITTAPINLRMNNQTPRIMFETVGKLAGINVLFDPDYLTQPGRPTSVELTNATLEQALDYLALMTRSFWKPITANAIFVTQDTAAKRTDYEEQVAQVFYISNVSTQADLTEILNAVRTVALAQRVVPVNSQNAVVVRGTADQVALAGMLIRNLDRPKPEVVVDVLLMEVDHVNSRDLGVSLVSGGSNGLDVPVGFTPSNPATTGSGSTSNAVTLSRLSRLSSKDFSISLPGAELKALMSNSGTRILQAPQVRAVDGMKASLKIGDRVPYSTGGFQPTTTTGTGLTSLYNSFQYLDVGVNVDITPKVHGTEEVTLHVELDISNVKDRIDIAGISQPEVGQRKVIHDIRLKEGEVSLLGGLVQNQETKVVSGLPVLSSIPGFGRLFSTESIQKSDSELLIAIIPHIVRAPDLDELNFKGIASGNERSVHLNYAPSTPAAAETAAPKPTAAPAPPAAAPEIPSPKPAVPSGAPSISFSPSPAEAQTGNTFNLTLQAVNVTDLFSAPLRIRFDPNVLRLNEVTRGGFLSGDGREILFTRNILNDSGEASVNLSRMPGNGGLSGSGPLLNLSFQVVGKGVTTVTVPQPTLQDSRGQAIRVAPSQVTVTIR